MKTLCYFGLVAAVISCSKPLCAYEQDFDGEMEYIEMGDGTTATSRVVEGAEEFATSEEQHAEHVTPITAMAGGIKSSTIKIRLPSRRGGRSYTEVNEWGMDTVAIECGDDMGAGVESYYNGGGHRPGLYTHSATANINAAGQQAYNMMKKIQEISLVNNMSASGNGGVGFMDWVRGFWYSCMGEGRGDDSASSEGGDQESEAIGDMMDDFIQDEFLEVQE